MVDLWGLHTTMEKAQYEYCINNKNTFLLKGGISKNNINATDLHQHFVWIKKGKDKNVVLKEANTALVDDILATQGKEQKIYACASHADIFCAYAGKYQADQSVTVTDQDAVLADNTYTIYHVITTDKQDIFFSAENENAKVKKTQLRNIPQKNNLKVTIPKNECKRLPQQGLPIQFDIKATLTNVPASKSFKKYTLFIKKGFNADVNQLATSILKKIIGKSSGFSQINNQDIVMYVDPNPAVIANATSITMCNQETDKIDEKKHYFKPGATYDVYTLLADATEKRVYYNENKPVQVQIPEIIKLSMLDAQINKFIAFIPNIDFTNQYEALISFKNLSCKIDAIDGTCNASVQTGFYFTKNNQATPTTTIQTNTLNTLHKINNDLYCVEINQPVSKNQKIQCSNQLFINNNTLTLGETYYVYAFVIFGGVTFYSENYKEIHIPYANGQAMKNILDAADVHADPLSPNFEIIFDANNAAVDKKNVNDIINGSIHGENLANVKAGLIFNEQIIGAPKNDMLNFGRVIGTSQKEVQYKESYANLQESIDDMKKRTKNEYKYKAGKILKENKTYHTYLAVYGNEKGYNISYADQAETIFITKVAKKITTPKYRNKVIYESEEEKMELGTKKQNIVIYKNVIKGVDNNKKIKIEKESENEYSIGEIQVNENYNTGNQNIKKSEVVPLDYDIFKQLSKDQKWTQANIDRIKQGIEYGQYSQYIGDLFA